MISDERRAELRRQWHIAKQRPWAIKEPWKALPELLDEVEAMREERDRLREQNAALWKQVAAEQDLVRKAEVAIVDLMKRLA